jgi:DNA topoisomerase-3
MVRVLNVAEKPSAAKEIAQLLSGGRFTKRAGLSKYNSLFEFDMQLNNVGMVRMCVTSVAGHLKTVDFDGRFATWQGCDPEELFDAPVKSIVPDANAPIARTLEAEARLSQRLILWLDCDREGEHIAHEVMEVCLAANRALDVGRARFSAFIEREIVHAAQAPVAPNRLAADAVAARIELDLRIGAAFTRHQTVRLQRLEGLERKVVSYGPCQFPTLGFVVDQYARVASFVPEPFWYLRLTLRKASNRCNCRGTARASTTRRRAWRCLSARSSLSRPTAPAPWSSRWRLDRHQRCARYRSPLSSCRSWRRSS